MQIWIGVNFILEIKNWIELDGTTLDNVAMGVFDTSAGLILPSLLSAVINLPGGLLITTTETTLPSAGTALHHGGRITTRRVLLQQAGTEAPRAGTISSISGMTS